MKIHEDELEVVREGISRPKAIGCEERVNEYRVFGKKRPALVLCAVKRRRNLVVWYTCSGDSKNGDSIEVTDVTHANQEKGAYLKPHADMIRRIPNKETWCGKTIERVDRTIFDSYLRVAQKVPFVRL